MMTTGPLALRALLVLTSSTAALTAHGRARAQSVDAAAPVASHSAVAEAQSQQAATTVGEVVVTVAKTTRSAVALGGVEMEKILPGVNPLKAIQTLPGVLFETADTWGNNEQNETLYVHGFSLQQLGYTLDGVPLGDQQYGNYNGLSPSRAVTSENVSRVVLSSGAGDLATASTSNLGGTIATYSSDPALRLGGTAEEVLGSYNTTRSYLRFDTGEFANGNSAYVSLLYHAAKAWDFYGYQQDEQVNAKFVHQGSRGRLTVYADFSNKVEPNEDSIVHDAADPNPPYTRPYIYPDFTAALNYLSVNGAPPASAGNNFSNYFSAAQRMDDLAYAKYDYRFDDDMSWSNQVYYHYDYGRGIVAGPINQAGLPGLFAVYYPGQNLRSVFGGSGYAVRTTEYLINRAGLISSFDWNLGQHQIELGAWFEHNDSPTHRVWYPFQSSSNDLTPYNIPTNHNFTQYESHIVNNVVQTHVQDSWRLRPDLLLQAGFKSSLQFAEGTVPIQQRNLPTSTNPTLLPTGKIDTLEGFLPEFGAVWDVSAAEQLFANVQNNLRQFITYGASGLSPWSLGSQAAFNLFKSTVKPETSWTYEVGVRTRRSLSLGPLSGVDGQASFYHVDFSNRLLQISSTPVILSLVSGSSILANVGSVTTNGVDVAGTLHFGQHLSFYDALSYDSSVYQGNYSTGAKNVVVQTSGKTVPGEPNWLNKFVASATYGGFETQLIGDYVGKRFTTYTNDLSVKSYFLVELQAGYNLPVPAGYGVRTARIALNVTNLTDQKGASTVVIGAASATYNTYPIPPRMYFVTLSAGF